MSTLPNLATTDAAPRIFSDELIADLQRLQKAAQKISSILDLDQLIDSVVKEVTGPPFGCLEASIYLHDEIRGEMVLTGVNGCDLHCKGHRLKVGQQGMVGHVAATGQVRYAPDVRKDQYYISCGHGTLSEVAIPLLVGRDVQVIEEDLAVLDRRVGIGELGFALAQRLHLGSRQHDPAVVGLVDEVVVERLAIGGDHRVPG